MGLVKQILEATFSPGGIIIVCLAGGALLLLLKRHSRWGRRLMLAGTCLYLLAVFSPLAEIVIRTLEKHYVPVLVPDSKIGIQFIVVLAGYGEEHPEYPVTSNISEETVCRIMEGVRLHQQLPGSRMLFSGGHLRAGDKSVASIMADFAEAVGVSKDRILIEGTSLNTYQNLLHVRKILKAEPFFLVTSAYHLRRAMAVANKLEIKALAAPAYIWTLQNFPPDLSWSQYVLKLIDSFAYPSHRRLVYLQRAYHEYVGYLWYQLLGRL